MLCIVFRCTSHHTAPRHTSPHLTIVLAVARSDPNLQVAARHHAMAVLSAILRKVGIARCVPHLVEYGLCCSAAWRTQEGSLKLVVAGLLQGNENGEARGEGEQSAGEVHRKGYHAGERAADETGPMHAEICRNYIGVLDKERLVRSVGALLGAERPEVLTEHLFHETKSLMHVQAQVFRAKPGVQKYE